ncbi:MAG TPA: glycosyltransferase [Candidatus Dormibacteraeota bacterium]|jgi:glycosyltransferase involved in cell wall biosynthesis|nr:glycosyltransferase [Candidatus Dormibacteraeota bacterium]
MRLGFIVPRYGRDIVGGVETLVRDQAEHLAAAGHHVEVLTTCARSHYTWRNELPAGTRVIEGVTVHRFTVTRPRDHGLMANLHARMDAGFDLDAEGQRVWVENTGYSDDLLGAIAPAADRLDALLFAPYLFASTVFGVAVRPERSIVIPCLHDEVYARFGVIQDALRAPAGLMFNSPAEMRLAERLLGASLPEHQVVGCGFAEPSPAPSGEAWRSRHRGQGDLIAYAGRRERAKNFPLLASWVAAHSVAIAAARPVRLATVGSGPAEAPAFARELVLDLGVVSQEEKLEVMAASLAVGQLSLNESFSYAIAEGWLSGTPAIVHAGCAVTREHCQRGGGGVWVESAEEFSEAVSLFQNDAAIRARMAASGREYILDEYGWPAVLSRLLSAVERMVRR